METSLSKVRILDFSHTTAGSFGTMLLADLGAEVIKIEAGEGDLERTVAGPQYKGDGYLHLSMNRNKKSIVLDLGTEAGREAFYELVKVSDIVWNNFRHGAMGRLGADYDTLKKINPRIIFCSITGYGSSGPYRDRPSWDIIAQALSGVMSITGEPGGPPIKPGITLGDLESSLFCTFGALAALVSREHTGVGQKVEVSQLDTMVAFMANQVAHYFCSGEVPRPLGTGHQTVIPFGAYPTKEGYLALGNCWPEITKVPGLEWLLNDPRFKDVAARQEHRKELDAILTELFRKKRAEDWLELLYAEGIAAAPVNTVDKTVVDPQVLNNKMIVSLRYPSGGEIKVAGNPIKMNRKSEEEYTPPPPLGQHTEQILTEFLGYSKDKIRRLKEEEKKHFQELVARKHKEL